MILKKVVVLTGNSLLTQGMTSRLRDYRGQLELRSIDLATSNLLSQIAEFQPEIVFFEASDLRDSPHCTLVDILNALPDAIVLEVRMDKPGINMIQTTQLAAANIEELVHLLGIGDRPSANAAASSD